MEFEYFKAGEEDQYVFLQLPWALLKDPRYKDTLSMHAKVLYGCMLNRQRLSSRNGWRDEDGNVFIFYTFEEICEDLCVSRKKANTMLNELESVKLILRKRLGQGKPNRIYVGKFFPEVSDGNFWEYPKETSGSTQRKHLEVSKGDGINNNNNKNDRIKINRINPSPDAMDAMRRERTELEEYFDETCNFDILKFDEPTKVDEIDGIRDLIIDTCMTRGPTVRISGEDKPVEVVRSRLEKLNMAHIQYVLGCMEKTTANISNIRQYLLAALYNAPATMDSYYRAWVNHDLAEGII